MNIVSRVNSLIGIVVQFVHNDSFLFFITCNSLGIELSCNCLAVEAPVTLGINLIVHLAVIFRTFLSL